MNATLSDIHPQARVQLVTDEVRFSSTERHHINGCKDNVGTFNQREFLTMRRTIITLAASAAISALALTGLQATAQAHEYRHHAIRYHHGDHDYRYFRWFSHDRHHRDHDRR
jgi:hypothetical protein